MTHEQRARNIAVRILKSNVLIQDSALDHEDFAKLVEAYDNLIKDIIDKKV